jgi:phosphatidylinositol alpha-mannosyltransferase
VMAAGTPVLASDIEAFRLVLEDGKVGELFATESSSDLAVHADLLLGDPQRRLDLASAATGVVGQYDWEQVARKVLAVYESVTWNGLKVREDSRLQALGRFTRLKDDDW